MALPDDDEDNYFQQGGAGDEQQQQQPPPQPVDAVNDGDSSDDHPSFAEEYPQHLQLHQQQQRTSSCDVVARTDASDACVHFAMRIHSLSHGDNASDTHMLD